MRAKRLDEEDEYDAADGVAFFFEVSWLGFTIQPRNPFLDEKGRGISLVGEILCEVAL